VVNSHHVVEHPFEISIHNCNPLIFACHVIPWWSEMTAWVWANWTIFLHLDVENWRAPKSRGETHLRVSQSQVAESWDSEARSRLPILERGRGSSWEPWD
jgi:hypothetical protein